MDMSSSDNLYDALVTVFNSADGSSESSNDQLRSNKLPFACSNISKHYSGFLPSFRVNKKGSVKTLIDSVSLIAIAALTGIVVATGGAAISKAISGIASSIKGVTKIMYNKHKSNKIVGKMSKLIGSRKNDSTEQDTAFPTINDITSDMNAK
jgi:hypothetical protein